MEPTISFDILSSFGDNVRLCEIEDDLRLYHYKECDENSNNFLKQIRGIVFDCGGNIVMRGFPYTPEYIVNERSFNEPISNFKVFQSHEGTILRVFFYKKWYVSTHKKLNASNSRWGSNESFESIFKRSIESLIKTDDTFRSVVPDYDRFFNILDKKKQYMFLVSNTPDNRIVCYGKDEPTLLHVGTFVDNHFTMNEKIGINTPQELFFDTKEDLVNYVDSINPFLFQGVILMGETGFYKIINRNYKQLYSIRGNCPNLKLRYLQLRKDEMLSTFCNLYSDKTHLFQSVETALLEISKNIHNVYIRRFVQKKFAVVLPNRYNTLLKCHTWYLQNKQPVTLELVYYMLLDDTPENILKIINRN